MLLLGSKSFLLNWSFNSWLWLSNQRRVGVNAGWDDWILIFKGNKGSLLGFCLVLLWVLLFSISKLVYYGQEKLQQPHPNRTNGLDPSEMKAESPCQVESHDQLRCLAKAENTEGLAEKSSYNISYNHMSTYKNKDCNGCEYFSIFYGYVCVCMYV